MRSLDSRLYHYVNRLAGNSSALHGVLRSWYLWGGMVVLAALTALAWWRGRFRADAPTAVAGSAWAALAATVTALLAQPVLHAVGRERPFTRAPGAGVLVGHPHSFGFPSVPSAVAGAVTAALWWAAGPAIGGPAAATALLLAFSCVYVGVSYPGDVVAGLLFGAAAAVVLRPAGMRLLSWLAVKVERSPLHLVVAAHRA